MDDGDVDPLVKAFVHLPFLFNPITLRKRKTHKNWRPSLVEISESVVINVMVRI